MKLGNLQPDQYYVMAVYCLFRFAYCHGCPLSGCMDDFALADASLVVVRMNEVP